MGRLKLEDTHPWGVRQIINERSSDTNFGVCKYVYPKWFLTESRVSSVTLNQYVMWYQGREVRLPPPRITDSGFVLSRRSDLSAEQSAIRYIDRRKVA